jgi:hypothetical protein
MKMTSRILLAAVALTVTSVIATAQENGGRRGGGDRGNFEQFRQQMNERMKTSLKVSDDEWAVLQPLIEKVQTKQRDAMASRGGFGGRGGGGDRGGGGGGGGGDRGGDRAGSAESQALRTALESESTPPDQLKAKLTAVRDARKRSAAELEAARADLQKVVTVRQEAVLVSMGILE